MSIEQPKVWEGATVDGLKTAMVIFYFAFGL